MSITEKNNMENLAPIVLFAYNRPYHIRQTIESLSANMLADKSKLFIFSDGPKNEETLPEVLEVRSYIKTISGFESISIIERNTNFGLANSIIDGVTNIINQYGKIIVLEDDLVTSPFFLTYMNEGLSLYENNEHVISIHGYVYPIKKQLPNYYFLRGADCSGWATWKRGWELFNPSSQLLLDEIRRQKLEELFNFNDSHNYTGMLQAQIEGKVASWAIRWYASAFLANRYTLYPGTSFVNHIGFDGSGTNCGNSGNYDIRFPDVYTPLPLINVNDSKIARRAFTQYFSTIRKKKNILKRVYNKLKKILNISCLNIIQK